ncbi:formin-like protein 5 [Felis catus]|uniref:formin-like protein 5 n=1 Tax=Felis catus TaxID=9685 RepID=UPI001D198D29|nr:formin-like protein 5 [Felis catus]
MAQTQTRPLTPSLGTGRKGNTPESPGHPGGLARGSPSTPGAGPREPSAPGNDPGRREFPCPPPPHPPAAPGAAPSPPGIKAVLPARGATESAPPALPPAVQLQPPPPRLPELSPMAHTAPRAPRLLGAALLLLLLVPAARRAAGAPVVTELRCQCLQTVQGIHPKNIQSVKVTPSGPHCAHTEVIATLKNGHEACLNPEAPVVKRIIEKMLSKGSNN